MATVVGALADGLSREVSLRDTPDTQARSVTVADVLQQEVDHTMEHVAEIRHTVRG